MSRRFITEKEVQFIDAINAELIQGTVGQTCIYYAISVEESEVHNVYDESTKKVWLQPTRFNARVTFNNPTVRSTGMGADTQYELEIEAHSKELEQRNIVPLTGDFVEFGQIVYEIASVTKPQMVYGMSSEKIMTKMMCVPSREGQFQIGNIRDEGIDNTEPVTTAKPRSLGGQ